MKFFKLVPVFLAIFFLSSCGSSNINYNKGLFVSKKLKTDWKYLSYSEGGRKKSSLSESVNMFKINPQNQKEIFAGTTNGFFKSTDRGRKFIKSDAKLASVYAIAVSKLDPKFILASGVSSSNFGRVSKSVDGGKTFSEIFTGRVAKSGIQGLAIKPDNKDVILIGTENGEILKSTDGGESWRITFQVFGNKAKIKFLNFDETSTSIAYFLVNNDGFYFSKDAGESFELMTEKSRNSIFNFDKTSQDVFSNYTFYHLEAVPNKSGNYFLVTEDQIYKTSDFGRTWNEVKFIVKPGNTTIYSIGIDPENINRIFVGTTGAIFKTENGGETWSEKDFSDMNNGAVVDFEFTKNEYDVSGNLIYEGEVFGAVNGKIRGKSGFFG
ncbi:MAG: hypothetical protein Fur0024_2760 [Patescibacteria group bacterium]